MMKLMIYKIHNLNDDAATDDRYDDADDVEVLVKKGEKESPVRGRV